jgi:hypothetical protein
MPTLSRRSFLRAAGLTGLAAAFGLGAASRAHAAEWGALGTTRARGWASDPLGRVILVKMGAYAKPDYKSEVREWLLQDTVVPVLDVVEGNPIFPHNKLWLETDRGYLYSSFVQPVRDIRDNRLIEDIGDGVWTQLMVPFADAYREPDPASPFVSHLYYSTVYWIDNLAEGTDGQPWYHIQEPYLDYWLPAHILRRVTREELAPISPRVPPEAKRVVVYVVGQRLEAYEYERVVFETRVSTGRSGSGTPPGEFAVLDKRHAVRMVGGEGPNHYNLPGIPWVSYFNSDWVALHGTYWHHDYGQRRSNGCVNCTPLAAKWLFRWTTPAADYDAPYTLTSDGDVPGTQVIVQY